jgi:hypothetical protein
MNPGFLNNKLDFYKAILPIKFQIRSDTTIPEVDAASIRAMAFEKGIVPSEYAMTNPSELWSEIAVFASSDRNVSQALKDVVQKVLDGETDL